MYPCSPIIRFQAMISSISRLSFVLGSALTFSLSTFCSVFCFTLCSTSASSMLDNSTTLFAYPRFAANLELRLTLQLGRVLSSRGSAALLTAKSPGKYLRSNARKVMRQAQVAATYASISDQIMTSTCSPVYQSENRATMFYMAELMIDLHVASGEVP